MLKIIENPTFIMDVRVNTRHTVGSFKVRFVAKPSDELGRMEKEQLASGRGPNGVLFGVVDWHETVEIRGQAIEHAADGSSVAKLLNEPGVGNAMVGAYFRGLWEEAEGNLPAPPAGC